MFFGAPRRRRFLNGAPIHPTGQDRIEGCRMLAPKSLFASWPPMQVESYSSIAYRVVLVAAGRHDAMISLTVKRDWDLAAADLILWEAGGMLTDAAGEKLIYNRPSAAQRATIGAGPKLSPLLLAKIAADATKNACRDVSRFTVRQMTNRKGAPWRKPNNCCIWCSAAS